MKFKNDIELQAGLEDLSGSTGTSGQILSSTETGTAWIDPSTIVAEAATLVVIACKNTSGAAIAQGTPVYQTGTVGATATIEIAPADALISENKLPAIGLLQTDLNNNGFGNVVITGELTSFTTSPIDGVVPTTGDKVFVKSGGGLTLTKPTGEGNGIQNMGLVGKVSGGNSGSITVSSIMRTNDVPNLPEGRIWVGDGNTIVSDTVYIDEPNNRVGIGTSSPNEKLSIDAGAQQDALSINSSDGDGPYAVWRRQGVSMGFVGNSNALSLSGNTNFGVRATNDLVFAAGGASERMRIDSDGNVGIGTTSPGTKLYVDGGESTFNRGNSAGTIATFRGQNAVKAVIGTATSYFTGNVGVGTTSPQQKLHIVDTDGANIILNSNTGAENNGIWMTEGGIASPYANGAYVHYDSTNNAFKINTGTTSLTTKLTIERDSGNVGIGTTSPKDTLAVYGTIAKETTTGYDGTFDNFIKYGHKNDLEGTGQTLDRWIGADATITAGAAAANKLKFKVYSGGASGSPIDIMTLDGAGNVGIGTTSPAYKLHVNGGDAQIANGSTATLYMNNSANYLYGDVNGVGIVAAGDNFRVKTNNSERLRIIQNGNVGIGTTSPLSQLSIGSNAITTKKPTVVIADGVAGGSLVIRGLSPILSFDRTGASPENKILMDGVGLEFKTGTLDAEGDVDFKINADGSLQLAKGAKISNQENTDIDSAAAEVVSQVAIGYTAVFFDFVVKKGTNVRSGTVYACHDGTNVEFTETSTNDLGDTSDVTLSVDKTSTNLRLIATVTSDDWSVKSLIRAI